MADEKHVDSVIGGGLKPGEAGYGLQEELRGMTPRGAAAFVVEHQRKIVEARMESARFKPDLPIQSPASEAYKFANLAAVHSQDAIDAACAKFGLNIETRRLAGEQLPMDGSVFKLIRPTITWLNSGTKQAEALSLETWERVPSKGEMPRPAL